MCHDGGVASPQSTQFAVAVHVLTYLAGAGDRPVGATELAASTQVTPVHVRRVLAPLREAGMLASTPGAHGGWRLLVDPADVGLDVVWRIVRGEEPVLAIHVPSPRCPVGRGIQDGLEAVDAEVARATEATLARTTVADLVAGVSAS
jgi:Rrf2 family protein